MNLANRLAAAQGLPTPEPTRPDVRRPVPRPAVTPAARAADRRPRPPEGPGRQGAVRAHGQPDERPQPQRGAAARDRARGARRGRRGGERPAQHARSGSASPPSWPTTCSAYGPLQRLLDDHAVTEIMVNGPENIYVEQSGKLTRTDVVLHLRGAPAPGHRPDRLPGRTADRRVVAAGRRPPGRRLARQRDHPAAGVQRVDADDPQVLQGPVHRRRPDRLRHPLAGDGRAARTPASRRGST